MDILGIVPPPVTPDFPIFSLINAGDKPDTAAEVEWRLLPINSAGLIKLERNNFAWDLKIIFSFYILCLLLRSTQ